MRQEKIYRYSKNTGNRIEDIALKQFKKVKRTQDVPLLLKSIKKSS